MGEACTTLHTPSWIAWMLTAKIEHARQKFNILLLSSPRKPNPEAAAELIKAAVKPCHRTQAQAASARAEAATRPDHRTRSARVLLEAGAAPEVRERARRVVQSFEATSRRTRIDLMLSSSYTASPQQAFATRTSAPWQIYRSPPATDPRASVASLRATGPQPCSWCQQWTASDGHRFTGSGCHAPGEGVIPLRRPGARALPELACPAEHIRQEVHGRAEPVAGDDSGPCCPEP